MSALYGQGLLTDSPITVDQMVFGYGRHVPQPGLVRPDTESMVPSEEAARGIEGFRQPLVFFMDVAKVHETEQMMKDWANLSKRTIIIDNIINVIMCQARNQVFSEQGSLRLCAQYAALATAFAEHFNSMHVKEYWMRNFFNFLAIDGATLILSLIHI